MAACCAIVLLCIGGGQYLLVLPLLFHDELLHCNARVACLRLAQH